MNYWRLVHRASEEIKASVLIGKCCGVAEGVNAFHAKLDGQVMVRNGYVETKAVRNRLLRKHEAVMEYLENVLGSFLATYDYKALLPDVPKGMQNKLWICWWQGLDNAPEIVRACIESVKRHAAGREVILITDENVNEYVEFPDWIVNLDSRGVLSKTHISDLLRLELLAKYGGLWLDATFFCCRDLSDQVYNAPVFSIKRPDYFHGSIASGYFANYSLGCDKSHRRVFATVRDLFYEYWRRQSFLIDYLLTDYLIVLAERHDPWIKSSIDAIHPNNSACDELIKVLDQPFNDELWREFSKKTDLFKLTWKQDFSKQIGKDDSFYGALLKNRLSLQMETAN